MSATPNSRPSAPGGVLYSRPIETPLVAREPKPEPAPYTPDPDDPDATYLSEGMMRPATIGMVHLTKDLIQAELIQPMQDAIRDLRKEVAALKLALAESNAKLSEAAAKGNENAFVLERLRLDNKGDPGPPGPRGRDGADGRIGPRGEKGSRGQRGQEITGWRVDVASYHATPVFYDNSEGPPLSLLPFFERYNAEVEEDEISFATEQTAERRAALELERVRLNKGLPPR
jgi:hypothetical protein